MRTSLGMTENENRLYNLRIGLILFAVYSLLYLTFVLLCAFAPAVMEWRPAGGLNLAIWYGFGLILAALLVALLYGVLCRTDLTTAESAHDQNVVAESDHR